MTRRRLTDPTRTCVGCRERRSAHRMVRCVSRDGGRVSTRSDGRGAWVCSIECFDRATTASGFARAWRRSVDRDGLGDLREPVMTVLASKNQTSKMTTSVKDCD